MNKKLAIISTSLVAVVVFASAFFYFFERLGRVETKLSQLADSPKQPVMSEKTSSQNNNPDSCGDACKAEIQKEVKQVISSITPIIQKSEVAKTQTSVKSGVTYIPMGSTYDSTSTDWYTIDDTATYIDLVHDYGQDATVSWEASLKVDHGNGQAFVRLWDDTNKIGVNGSEMATTNNSEYQIVTTGVIPLWKGRNLYKVQIKSLNSFVVSYTGGKIRIAY